MLNKITVIKAMRKKTNDFLFYNEIATAKRCMMTHWKEKLRNVRAYVRISDYLSFLPFSSLAI